jgi:imidazolonepropionase-like amidohydrolase
VRYEGEAMQRLAAAGITAVLAVPEPGIFRGQSALVNVLAEPEGDEISGVGADRHGMVVIKSPVAEHVTFAGRSGGGGYPGTILGTIAFVRQTFYDAQWQHTAHAFADRHKDAPLPAFEPVLDSLEPALEGKLPVAFDAAEAREITRALAMAKEFNLDPIIVGANDALPVIDDLKAAHARVVLSVATGAAGGGRGGRGGATDTPLRVLHANENMPKIAAALEKAGIPYAFTSQGLQAPSDFLRTVGRSVREGGLAPDAALRALTSGAAKMAGAGDRVGTLEKGRIANVVLTDGDLFGDRTQVKAVFVGGRQVELGAVQAPNTGRSGRGGGSY